MNAENGIDENSLARQRSIYSLTLEGFQEALGESNESFGSMNMEELLKNIWTAEESQAMVAAMGTLDGSESALPRQASLQRHGSLTLRNGVSQKSVDDVWKSINQGLSDVGGVGLSSRDGQQRQITFGEMTLEDFLVKAGVVKEEDKAADSSYPFVSFGGTAGIDKTGGGQVQCGVVPISAGLPPPRTELGGLPVIKNEQVDAVRLPLQTADLFNNPYQNLSVQHLQQGGQFFQPSGNAENAVIFSNSGNQSSNGCLMADTVDLRGLASSAGGPSLNIDSGLNRSAHLRKRLAEGAVERTMERRQRRMIKNRESAARSRERKQAYTVELEDEVTQLKQENLKLKQKQDEAERKKRQVMAMMPIVSQQASSAKPVLRRTRTSPW